MVGRETPSWRAATATFRPPASAAMIRARSTVRAWSVRERANASTAWSSSGDNGRSETLVDTGHLLGNAPLILCHASCRMHHINGCLQWRVTSVEGGDDQGAQSEGHGALCRRRLAA